MTIGSATRPGNGRARGYRHREAFCLMLYRCQLCGTLEVLWNSRDGVTSLSIPCRDAACNARDSFGSPMIHDLWEQDTCLPGFTPWPGLRTVRDMTADEWRGVMRRRLWRAVGTTYALPPDEWDAVIERSVADLGAGEPWIDLTP